MAGLNKVYILGRLGADPELKDAGQNKVARLSIATSEKFKDKQGKEQEVTTWHTIVVWGKLSELCGKYLYKGAQALVEGKIQTRTYEKDGEKKYVTEIVANNVQFLSPPSSAKDKDPAPWGE